VKEPTWRKSSRSQGSGNCVQTLWRKARGSVGNNSCVEVAEVPGEVWVQDSKNPGPKLVLTEDEFREFIGAIKTGALDKP